jgi:hypothetical protein
MANLWYYDEITDEWTKLEGKSNAVKVILCATNPDGDVEPLHCDADGKLITTTGA